MRILAIRPEEDCFDKSVSATVEVDDTWSRPCITSLSRLGRLEYFPDFPRPFFRLHAHAGWQLKGVEGSRTCQLLSTTGIDEARAQLSQHLAQCATHT